MHCMSLVPDYNNCTDKGTWHKQYVIYSCASWVELMPYVSHLAITFPVQPIYNPSVKRHNNGGLPERSNLPADLSVTQESLNGIQPP